MTYDNDLLARWCATKGLKLSWFALSAGVSPWRFWAFRRPVNHPRRIVPTKEELKRLAKASGMAAETLRVAYDW